MNVLANVPIWVLFIWIAVVYITGHLLGLPRDDQPNALGRGRMLGLRIVSTLFLVLALFTVNRTNVLLVLVPTLLGFVSGYLNGRSVDMERLRERERLRRERLAARKGEQPAAEIEENSPAQPEENPTERP